MTKWMHYLPEGVMVWRGVPVDHAAVHCRALKLLHVRVAIFAGANARWAQGVHG